MGRPTMDGGYMLIGMTASNAILIKTDSSGIMEWNQTYGGLDNGIGMWGVQTGDGGYIITGSTTSDETGFDIWLLKTDTLGRIKDIPPPVETLSDEQPYETILSTSISPKISIITPEVGERLQFQVMIILIGYTMLLARKSRRRWD